MTPRRRTRRDDPPPARSPFEAIDPARAWEPWSPSPNDPWDLAKVAHLHRRAGFDAPRRVLVRDLAEGPDAAVARILRGEERSLDDQTPDLFESRADLMAKQLGGSPEGLQTAWLHRMIHTPRPLLERMTLFWHDHFATSVLKVGEPDLMRRQIDLLRVHALGDFRALLVAVGKNPAMLLWLDSAASRRLRPNENYAREVMELFALGRGNYTERDIQEAARAFTGRFVNANRYQWLPEQHDDGEKTILGETGRFDGDDVVDILLRQPACARFLAAKLVRHFLDEVHDVPPEIVESLARIIRHHQYRMAGPVETILRSRILHHPAFRRQRVKSPVEHAVGLVRSLEIVRPTVKLPALAAACVRMGQQLGAPPSVAGWDAGPAWLNTATILARANLALALVGPEPGELGRAANGLEWRQALAENENQNQDQDQDPLETIVAFHADLWFQDAWPPSARARVAERARQTLRETGASPGDHVAAARVVMALAVLAPEFPLA